MQIFIIYTKHSFIPKIHYARKNKYEPLKSDESKGFRELINFISYFF